MELALLVYAIEVFSKLPNLFVISIIISLIVSFILTMIICAEWCDLDYDSPEKRKVNEEKRKNAWKWVKIFMSIAVFLALLVTLIPSKKTMYVMVGAYAAQKVSEDPDVKRLSGKALQIIEGKMDEYITEAEKEVSTKIKGDK